MGPHGTFRWLMAVYIGLLMPMCCCYTSASAGSPATPDSLHDHAEHVHDHGHPAKHDDQAAGNNHDPDRPGSGQHDGSCDCGCVGPDHQAFTVEKPVGLDWTVQAVQPSIGIVLQAPRRSLPLIRSAAPAPRPPTSLLRLHCALVV